MADDQNLPGNELSAEEKRKKFFTGERSEHRQAPPKARPARADDPAEGDMLLALAQGPPKEKPEKAVLPDSEQKRMRDEMAATAPDPAESEIEKKAAGDQRRAFGELKRAVSPRRSAIDRARASLQAGLEPSSGSNLS